MACKELPLVSKNMADSPIDAALHRWSRAGVALGIALTVAGFLGSWLSMRESNENDDWVAHTEAVRAAIETILARATEIETGARGFAATGDEAFLGSFEQGYLAIATDLERLRSLTLDDLAQQNRMERLRKQINLRSDNAQLTVAERWRTGEVPADAYFLEGKRRMDVVIATIQEMRNDEARLLDHRRRNAAATRQRTKAVLLISSLAGVTLLLFAGFVTGREINRSASMGDQVRALNRDLKWRVDDHKKELQAEIKERKRVEGAFLTSERRYLQLFECSIDGICFNEIVFDPEGKPCDFRWLDVNPSYELLTGLRREQVIGRCAHEVLPDLEPYWLELFSRVVATGEPAGFEQFASPLGRCYQGNAYRTEGGKFGVSFTDVTKRKQVEEALQETSQRLQNIIESAMDAIITVDAEQRIVLFNRAASRIFRCPAVEAIGQPLAIFIPERFRGAHAGHIRNFGATETTNRVMGTLGSLRALRADGAEIQIEASISQVESSGKKLFSVILRDVTEREKAERAMRELAAIVTSSSDAIISKNLDGVITNWNPGAEFIYGYSAAEMIGQPVTLAIPPDRLDEFQTIMELIKGGEKVLDCETVRVRKGGQRIQVALSVSPIRDHAGKVVGASTISRDITERQRAQEEIRNLNNELEQRVRERTAQLEAANKELEAFTYSVSHDLRAPLRHISGFSKMLAEEFVAALPPDAQHYLERIQSGTLRMGQLVDDLLNLGRVGRQALHLQRAGLRTIVDEVIDELQPEYTDREVEWEIGDLPFLDCDPGLLKQVFQNLIANALKFTRPRAAAVIEVGQQEEGGAPVIFVRDNGVGFSMKYSDKLFGVFQRLHRQEDFEGTGVGLATVQRIVQKHGGRIWAEAELDKGATFYFTIGSVEHNELKTKTAAAGEKS